MVADEILQAESLLAGVLIVNSLCTTKASRTASMMMVDYGAFKGDEPQTVAAKR